MNEDAYRSIDKIVSEIQVAFNVSLRPIIGLLTKQDKIKDTLIEQYAL